MSNNYDIDIKMNYFLSGDDYDSSLKGLKKFKEIVQMHIERWEYHVSSEETFNESWQEMYGEQGDIELWMKQASEITRKENERESREEVE